jgi:hypothetical protein
LTGFDSLTGVAGLDILADMVVHLRPVEHSMDSGICSFDALVSCNWCIMVVMEDLGSEFSLGNAKTFLIIDEVAI